MGKEQTFFKDGYSGMSESDVREHIVGEWKFDAASLESYDILAASGYLGDYEEGGWFLIRDRKTGGLFEASGSHCSCYGFEDQFEPAPTTIKYLLSNKFHGHGVDEDALRVWVLEYAGSRGELPVADSPSA